MTQIENEKTSLEENTKFKDGVNKNARLMVRNISFKATEDALKEHFSKYGTVEEVKLLRKPDGKLVGCGFVHFTYVPMANKAIAATNKKPFLDRPLNVTWAVPKNKYVEQIQGNNVKKRTDSASSGDNQPYEKKENETKQEKKMRVNRNARLIIRNVSFKATGESLQEHFKPYGDILEVKLLKKPDGKLVGCAFVHFKNVPMAKKALLNTNMKPFLGRPISVDWAVAKNKYMQHIVNQQQEMEDKVKKEDSDSDDDDTPLNTSNEALKDEIKSESEEESDEEGSDADDKSIKSESDSDEEEKSDEEEADSDNEDDDEEEESEDEEEDMEEEDIKPNVEDRKRIQLNDAEDGCTVFITNIPFSIEDYQLKEFAENSGPVKYALICIDKMTEHSKGSGFVKFENKEDADKFLSLPAEQLKLSGQLVQVKPALKRENLQKDKKKEAKDNRNLYLVKEGVVVAGTKAAEGVSASDMTKRLALERSKTQMLKNLNRFVSRYRLVVSNLPQWCEDGKLRRVCVDASGKQAVVTEARVMKDLRGNTGPNGKHMSKGYGFVMFTRHEDALACLRKLNNNPDIFDRNNRPIVSFSIEDRTALNARKKRLEKSIANNPLANKQNPEYNAENSGNASYQNRKRKSQQPPDEGYVKKGRFNKNEIFNKDGNKNAGNFNRNDRFNNDGNKNTGNFNKNAGNFNKNGGNFNKNAGNYNRNTGNFNKNAGKYNKNDQSNNEGGKFVRRQNDEEMEYAGLTAKEGALHKMRNNHKLRSQAQIHRETVKRDKKTSKRAMRLKRAAKERVKQPKQKMNKDNSVLSRRNKNKFKKAKA